MPKVLLTPDRLALLGTITFPAPPAGGGDWPWGKGLAVRRLPSGRIACYTGSWSPQVIIEAFLPDTIPGRLADARVVGNLQFSGERFGLCWDERVERLYSSANSIYDTNPATAATLSWGHFESGMLVKDSIQAFASRSDKMTMGGICPLPSDLANEWGYAYAAGWGGYQSIVATGPASMGPAVTLFNRPTTATIPNTPVLGYPYTTGPQSATLQKGRVLTPLARTQEFGDGWPPTYWTWTDHIWQSGWFIDSPGLTGLVVFVQLGTDRCWYGSNDPAHPDGVPAAVNSKGVRHYLLIYDPADLTRVLNGELQQWEVQPRTIVPWEFQGLTYPCPGEPGFRQQVVGIAQLDDRLYVSVRFADNTTRHLLYVYQIVEPTPTTLEDRVATLEARVDRIEARLVTV